MDGANKSFLDDVWIAEPIEKSNFDTISVPPLHPLRQWKEGEGEAVVKSNTIDPKENGAEDGEAIEAGWSLCIKYSNPMKWGYIKAI